MIAREFFETEEKKLIHEEGILKGKKTIFMILSGPNRMALDLKYETDVSTAHLLSAHSHLKIRFPKF